METYKSIRLIRRSRNLHEAERIFLAKFRRVVKEIFTSVSAKDEQLKEMIFIWKENLHTKHFT